MKTQLSTITAEFNGQTGRYDLTITHMPDELSEFAETKSSHLFLQGVIEELKNFQRIYDV